MSLSKKRSRISQLATNQKPTQCQEHIVASWLFLLPRLLFLTLHTDVFPLLPLSLLPYRRQRRLLSLQRPPLYLSSLHDYFERMIVRLRLRRHQPSPFPPEPLPDSIPSRYLLLPLIHSFPAPHPHFMPTIVRNEESELYLFPCTHASKVTGEGRRFDSLKNGDVSCAVIMPYISGVCTQTVVAGLVNIYHYYRRTRGR